VWELLRIGYQVPVGWLVGGTVARRTGHHRRVRVRQLPQISVRDVRSRLESGEIELLNVRQPGQWPAATPRERSPFTGAELPARLHELADSTKPVAVACGSGYRSSGGGQPLGPAHAGRC